MILVPRSSVIIILSRILIGTLETRFAKQSLIDSSAKNKPVHVISGSGQVMVHIKFAVVLFPISAGQPKLISYKYNPNILQPEIPLQYA